MIKKLLIAFFGLIAALVLAAILIPLFIDVDKYRPMLVEKTNEHLNGKLELGHLSLSLWGQVRIQVDGLKITDSAEPSGRFRERRVLSPALSCPF